MLWLVIAALTLALSPTLSTRLDQIERAASERRYADAIAQLREIEAGDAEIYRLNNLAYLEAVLHLTAGHTDTAIEILEPLVTSVPLLREYVLGHLIEASEAKPLLIRARYFEALLNDYPDHPNWSSLAYRYAQLLKDQGNVEGALKWFAQLSGQRRGSFTRQARLQIFLLQLEQGLKEKAADGFAALIVDSERDDVAYQAALQLDKLQPAGMLKEEDARRRARVFMNNRRSETARRYFQHLKTSFPRSRSQDEYAYLCGRTYVLEGDFKGAIAAYEEAYRRFPNSNWGIYSKYLIANTQLRLHQYQAAAETYRYIIEKHPDSKYTINAHYNLADCYRWIDRDDLVEETARTGLSKADKQEKDQFHYYLARLFVERAQYEKSLEHWYELDHLTSTQLPSGVTREEVYFWKGYCLEQQGEILEAGRAYREAYQGRPNYFAYLASFQMDQHPEIIVTKDDPVGWSGKLIPARQAFDRSAEREESKDSASDLKKIRELLFLRLYGEAALEIKRIGAAATSGDRADWLYNVAYYAEKGALPSDSILAAEMLQNALSPHTVPTRYPEALRLLLYPRHFWELVREAGGSDRVEPELILSVIRQESRFQSDAKSGAAARGLMQFTTGTARQIARALELPAPKEADLYDPKLSIRFGSYYLSKLLREFDGSAEKALAAYNGGAENVQRWAAKTKRQEPAFFVANIGFRETKLYVLKVLGDYYSYRSIYAPTVQPVAGTAF